mmetsp:Transcript_52996/g.121705  ORF Transcript_52996/g.121705 Transcript_52996/m.121705 type:complete len:297 (-) Transcript_52996:226-1116(-)
MAVQYGTTHETRLRTFGQCRWRAAPDPPTAGAEQLALLVRDFVGLYTRRVGLAVLELGKRHVHTPTKLMSVMSPRSLRSMSCWGVDGSVHPGWGRALGNHERYMCLEAALVEANASWCEIQPGPVHIQRAVGCSDLTPMLHELSTGVRNVSMVGGLVRGGQVYKGRTQLCHMKRQPAGTMLQHGMAPLSPEAIGRRASEFEYDEAPFPMEQAISVVRDLNHALVQGASARSMAFQLPTCRVRSLAPGPVEVEHTPFQKAGAHWMHSKAAYARVRPTSCEVGFVASSRSTLTRGRAG